MTAEEAGKWILQGALAMCSFGGLAVVTVAARTGWIKTAISWALVSFVFVGAMMILSPKWTSVVFQWKDLTWKLSQLEEANKALLAQAQQINSRLQVASTLREFNFINYPKYVTSEQFAAALAQKLGAKPDDVKNAIASVTTPSVPADRTLAYQPDYPPYTAAQ